MMIPLISVRRIFSLQQLASSPALVYLKGHMSRNIHRNLITKSTQKLLFVILKLLKAYSVKHRLTFLLSDSVKGIEIIISSHELALIVVFFTAYGENEVEFIFTFS